MPKAFLKTKNRGGHKVYKCTICGKPIEPGTQYYTWKFNHGGRYFQHAEHGPPKPSQLTNSKMGEVYDAVEAFDVSAAEQPEAIYDALSAVASAAESVAQQYAEAADGIEASWPSGNPTSEACRATADELGLWAQELTSWKADHDTWRDAKEAFDEREDWLVDMREEAESLLDGQPEYQG